MTTVRSILFFTRHKGVANQKLEEAVLEDDQMSGGRTVVSSLAMVMVTLAIFAAAFFKIVPRPFNERLLIMLINLPLTYLPVPPEP